MAVEVVTNAYVQVNSVDLSDHVARVRVNKTYEEVDVTAMGDTARQRLPGLSDDSIEVDFWQDYAASEVDATLFPLAGSNTAFTINVNPKGSTTATTNPRYSGSFHLYDYSGIDAEVGQATRMSVRFLASGAITRALA